MLHMGWFVCLFVFILYLPVFFFFFFETLKKKKIHCGRVRETNNVVLHSLIEVIVLVSTHVAFSIQRTATTCAFANAFYSECAIETVYSAHTS